MAQDNTTEKEAELMAQRVIKRARIATRGLPLAHYYIELEDHARHYDGADSIEYFSGYRHIATFIRKEMGKVIAQIRAGFGESGGEELIDTYKLI